MAIAGVPCPLVRANGTATANDTAVCCLTPAFAAGASPAALNLTLSVPEVGSALLAADIAGTFTYGAPPAVTGLSPAAAHVGSTVHLQGTNLTGVGGAPPKVTLGGVACAVTASGSEWVNCTAGDAPLGVGLEVVVTVPGVGLARTSSGVSFTQQAAITDLTLNLTLTLTLNLTQAQAQTQT